MNSAQENDIFLGWEKGAGKKWTRSRRKGGADVSLEEMKKQAAVQCLRSASDEVTEYNFISYDSYQTLCLWLLFVVNKAEMLIVF